MIDLATESAAESATNAGDREKFGAGATATDNAFPFLNVFILNTTWQDAMNAVMGGDGFRSVGFLHGQGARLLLADPGLAATFSRLSMVFADGIAMRLACRLNGTRLRDNVNGTDMFPKIAALCAADAAPIYLLGATDAEIAAFTGYLRQRFPTLTIAGTHCGFFPAESESAIIADIAGSGARWLFVGMGCPRQESFIARNATTLAATGLRGAMGVGGLFTTLRTRAPAWLIRLHLEWAWRLVREPRRLYRRYLVEIPSLLAVLAFRRLAGK